MSDPAQRIDELLKANTLLMQDCRDAQKAAATAEWRIKFWQSQCEKHALDKAIALEEVERLRIKINSSAHPTLFDP